MNTLFSFLFKLIGGLLFMTAGAYLVYGKDIMVTKIFHTGLLSMLGYGFIDLGYRALKDK